MQSEHKLEKHNVIHYTVDGEPQETDEKLLTAKKILENAGIDPNLNYLEEILGKEQKSYKDDPNVEIHMHENQKFISIYNGPTPVS